MKLDKICRACLAEKANLKPIFNACVANMMMTCASIQVMVGDSLPDKICTQCLQMVNRSISFRQMCEKSDSLLREYTNGLNLQSMNLATHDDNQLFSTTDALQQSSFFGEIFSSTTASSLVDNFSDPNIVSVDNDLADTMQSLQTIAEQCLPETWENMMSTVRGTEENSCNQFIRCQFCEESLMDEWSLVEHMKVHTGQGQSKYMCTICCKEFSTSCALERHINVHSLTLGELENAAKEQHSCKICGQRYDDEDSLKSHVTECHSSKKASVKKNVCNICGKSYSQYKFLLLHARVHTGERPLSCELCGKKFSLPSSLHKHRLVHMAERPYKCSMCGKGFKQSSNLTAHIRSHSGIKTHICSVCRKAFSTNFNLEAHMRLHTGEKPYSCSHCDYSFASKSQLRKHFSRHTGERPYKCWHCGKSFRQKNTRDTHVRYHTGERPFVCHICTKTYIAASHLRVHVKGHLGDKKYHCGTCTKSFVLARTLKNHLRTHTDELPCTCKYCGQQYSKSALEQHVQRCHVFK